MIDRKAPVLYEKAVVANAIRRYETCWLPAQVHACCLPSVTMFLTSNSPQAAKPDLNNIPPLDVHWVWHVHMLCPISYREDCLAICGAVVDHKLLSADEVCSRSAKINAKIIKIPPL
jgi:hypothetical protein